jgi:hypothetical protein
MFLKKICQKQLKNIFLLQKRNIVQTKVKINPTKLPTLNPEEVHKNALKQALSKNIAIGKKSTDLNTIRNGKKIINQSYSKF